MLYFRLTHTKYAAGSAWIKFHANFIFCFLLTLLGRWLLSREERSSCWSPNDNQSSNPFHRVDNDEGFRIVCVRISWEYYFSFKWILALTKQNQHIVYNGHSQQQQSKVKSPLNSFALLQQLNLINDHEWSDHKYKDNADKSGNRPSQRCDWINSMTC